MKFSLALVGLVAASSEVAPNRPVSKVITLLKDMSKQLEKEAETDEEIFNKFQCWCTTNDEEKTKAIADAEAHEADLQASIEEGTAKSASLGAEIKNLEKEVAANQQALDTATKLRQKELAEFNAEEKDLLQSIGGLKSAVTVLKKHNSFLQTGAKANTRMLQDVATLMDNAFRKYGPELAETITPSQRKAAEEFIQAPGYANQSGEIFGVLTNMLDNFTADLESAQKTEATNQSNYEELKAAKSEEIAAGQEQIDKKTDEKATTDEQVANDKTDKEDTMTTREADEKYLANLKEKCKQTSQEFEARTKTRTEEIAAVGQALKFLTSDDAHDLFTKTFNFVQVNSKSAQTLRQKASVVLSNAALATKNPKLSALAVAAQLDAFTKVKKAIDDMIADLLAEKADEIKLKDFCTKAFNDNASETTAGDRKKADLIASIDALTGEIERLTKAIADEEAAIAETKLQLKRAGENRQAENQEFQTTVAEQRATVELLTKTMNVLKGFYEKSAGTALVQQPAGPPPPAGFKSYENNAGGGGVIGMITQIVNDAKAMEAEATHDEKDAQKTYEELVKESNATIKASERQITNHTSAKANAETDKASDETSLDTTENELAMLANEKADLHKSCDFTVNNFDARQQARDEEVEALRTAKSILSGAK